MMLLEMAGIGFERPLADKDFAGLPDELGDLLLQVIFHARMAEVAGVQPAERRVTHELHAVI